MLSRHTSALALASALVVAGAVSAHAGNDPDISKGNCDLMSFCVGVGTHGSKGSNSRGSGQGQQASTGGKESKCTVRKTDPQPPPGSLFYGGQGKIVYERTCGNGLTTFFAAAPGASVPAIDPAVLAQHAVDKMQLLGPDVASPRAAGKYTVGVPMWMWVNQGATTFGPNMASASAGGITVTAAAKVSKIVWQMGDGSSVTCSGPGTPYAASEGMSQSPTCGHVYSKTSAGARSGKYALTATSTWTIDWQGGGAAGQLTEVRQTNVQVAIGEVQVVS
ncbi:ATP/GTP-binding protein [Streptomyces rhizosphaerihabitans]|uniref:ATP/GTP-binding protein n=1 Tax=Streptomyces rhizosphaerihabitans TaxID=1266770 RepID=UPI0021C02E76|nr:ATP/GTP-binding protein [Streptomyces rhizosphaerihabitans]MCT9010291.1 ATP/GTP-binding protein [Streptomyces rhizosphaerihabitans]